MKKVLMLVCFLFAAGMAMAQNAAQFKETKYDFGKVALNHPATKKFTFVNNSSKPLIIENAEASCGCTTPVYPKKPILPKHSAEIEVTFNAATAGHFNKSVTVKFANEKQPVLLFVSGNVEK